MATLRLRCPAWSRSQTHRVPHRALRHRSAAPPHSLGHIEQLVQVHSSVGELTESSLLLLLHFCLLPKGMEETRPSEPRHRREGLAPSSAGDPAAPSSPEAPTPPSRRDRSPTSLHPPAGKRPRRPRPQRSAEPRAPGGRPSGGWSPIRTAAPPGPHPPSWPALHGKGERKRQISRERRRAEVHQARPRTALPPLLPLKGPRPAEAEVRGEAWGCGGSARGFLRQAGGRRRRRSPRVRAAVQQQKRGFLTHSSGWHCETVPSPLVQAGANSANHLALPRPRGSGSGHPSAPILSVQAAVFGFQ